jgi:hypothetical protein
MKKTLISNFAKKYFPRGLTFFIKQPSKALQVAKVRALPGNANYGGKLSTVNLLIEVACFVKM